MFQVVFPSTWVRAKRGGEGKKGEEKSMISARLRSEWFSSRPPGNASGRAEGERERKKRGREKKYRPGVRQDRPSLAD